MAQKRYYAVARGRQPGIYTAWDGENGARAQVDQFPGAHYRGFATREEAEAWLRAQSTASAEAVASVAPATASAGSESASGPTPAPVEWVPPSTPATTPVEPPSALAATVTPSGASLPLVTIYTDGACLGNPGPGGYGVVLIQGQHRKELSGGFRLTTNNRMELRAAIEGLKALRVPCRVTLYTDSRYLVDAMTKGWVERWRRRGWMRTSKEAALNPDLWEELYQLCQRHQVEFRWVKGHDGDKENERCDALAQAAAQGKDLSADEGYQKP